MKLINLGEELDVTKEHELITESEFGYKIDIKYTAESLHKVKEDTAYNAIECHWRFPSLFDDEGVISEKMLHLKAISLEQDSQEKQKTSNQ